MSPTRPPQPCAHPGCAELVDGGLCSEHRRHQDAQRRNRRGSQLYKTQRWLRLRRIVLSEVLVCQCRGCDGLHRHQPCYKPATDVDHIVAVSADGAEWDRANLQALCHACHSRKTRNEQLGTTG